jgi:peroxiredoxin
MPEIKALSQKTEALRKEKYNAAMLDFMKDRPFSKRFMTELWMIAIYDQTPAIVENAREIFKKIPEEAMNEKFVVEAKARLYADQVKVGEQMKDFTLFDRQGNKHQLSEFKGKYTILEFTWRGCGGCIFIKPFLEEFYKRNKDKAEIIAIYNDTEKNWMEEGQEHKVSYHEWNDHARSAEPVAAYGATVFPTFVIIDPDGKILEMPAGSSGFLNVFKYIPDAEVEKKLKEALK